MAGNLRLPKDARRVPNVDPWEELHKHVNELYWGDREQNGPPAAKATAYRAVAVIGCVIAEKPGFAGELVLSTGGSWTFDDQQPETALALAAQLREAADMLERKAGS